MHRENGEASLAHFPCCNSASTAHIFHCVEQGHVRRSIAMNTRTSLAPI